MKYPTLVRSLCLALAAGPALIAATAAATAAEPVKRELYILVEIEAEQNWLSETEEYGRQHFEGTTTQSYELRTQLRSDGIQYKRNILDRNQEKRLKAKTIHLARQAKKEMEASGGDISIPTTPEEKQQLTRRMQEEMTACGGDMQCRNDLQMRYAKLFAAAQYPEAVAEEPGGGQYLYFEPYKGCPVHTRVTMDLTIEGIEWDEGKNELVPFKETRQADTTNAPTDIPLCERYLAVIDTKDEENPFYLENFYLPSAIGETVIERPDGTTRTTEKQPQLTDVLGWVHMHLKHAPASGTAEDTVRLTRPLNEISREIGDYSGGQAKVKLTWHFKEPEEE